MKNAHWLMDGLSLHYYVHPQGWEEKGSALEFDEAEWQVTCEKAAYMDELLTRHSAIMDQYDPEQRVRIQASYTNKIRFVMPWSQRSP